MAPHDPQTPTPRDQAELQDDIEATRARLASTVEQLSRKVDVRYQAGRRRTELLVAAGGVVTVALLVLVWRRKH